MNEEREKESWLRYCGIWRDVLIKVLDWRSEDVEAWVEEQKRYKDSLSKNPAEGFSFFYDPPAQYLFLPILGNGLHGKIMEQGGIEPILAWRELTEAIFDGHLNLREGTEDYDWEAAKKRYGSCRKRIETQLGSRSD